MQATEEEDSYQDSDNNIENNFDNLKLECYKKNSRERCGTDFP